MARPRIRQFAGDMGISYDEAKGLIKEGRRRRDGGTEVSYGAQHGQDAARSVGEGSQVAGLSVQEVMDVVERDTHGRST